VSPGLRQLTARRKAERGEHGGANGLGTNGTCRTILPETVAEFEDRPSNDRKRSCPRVPPDFPCPRVFPSGGRGEVGVREKEDAALKGRRYRKTLGGMVRAAEGGAGGAKLEADAFGVLRRSTGLRARHYLRRGRIRAKATPLHGEMQAKRTR